MNILVCTLINISHEHKIALASHLHSFLDSAWKMMLYLTSKNDIFLQFVDSHADLEKKSNSEIHFLVSTFLKILSPKPIIIFPISRGRMRQSRSMI